MIDVDNDVTQEMAAKGKRLDNRGFEDYRDILIETGIVTSADGSARVKIGDTEVVCGVKAEIGEPFSDTPDEGVLMCAAELLPLASPEFEFGPPSEGAIELSRVVDRAIRESKAIDFKKLCVKPREAVWMVYVDMDILNDDGNLIDTACLAAAVALMNTKMPVAIENDGRYEIDHSKRTGPLPMAGIPISTTFVKIGNAIMLDPSLNEIKAMDARLTVGTIDKDGKIYLCSMQKGGTQGLSIAEIERIIQLSQDKSEELRKIVLEKTSM